MAKKRSATAKLFWIIGILVVLAVIIGVVGSQTGAFGGRGSSTEVEVADVEVRTVTQTVTASGKVQPEVEVKISPDVSGEIIRLNVREGDRVTRGDLLVRIKQDDYLATVDQARAGVSQSKAVEAQRRADFLSAELERKRKRGLHEAGAIPESEMQLAETQFDIAEAALEAAKYSVQSAEARLTETQDQLNKTVIYAPMTGTVSMLSVELGERVVGTSQMAGTEMMRIALLEQMEIEVDVNENDVINVAIGDTASIEIDAYPDQSFRGLVTEIANSARVTGQGTQQQVTNFPVKVRILGTRPPQPDRPGGGIEAPEVDPLPQEMAQFRPGMSGTVDIYTQTIEDAVAVPIQAVTVRDFARVQRNGDESREAGNDTSDLTDDSAAVKPADAAPMGMPREDLRRVVFLFEEGHAQMVEVETGISDDTHIHIRSGLDGGERVIIGPYSAVSRTLEDDDVVAERSGGPSFTSVGR